MLTVFKEGEFREDLNSNINNNNESANERNNDLKVFHSDQTKNVKQIPEGELLRSRTELEEYGYVEGYKSGIYVNSSNEVEVVFLKYNDNTSKKSGEEMKKWYNSVVQLQLYPITPTVRKSDYLKHSAKTMYCIGCSKQWKSEYTNTKVEQLKNIQPIINYLNEKFQQIINIIKSKGFKLIFPEDQHGVCENCTDHILNLISFKRGSFTFDYFAQGHIDRADKTYTIFIVLWPFGGDGGFFFHSGVNKFFFCEHGDIMFFSGKKIHGTVENTNPKKGQHKVTVGLFT